MSRLVLHLVSACNEGGKELLLAALSFGDSGSGAALPTTNYYPVTKPNDSESATGDRVSVSVRV
jgi:hypothetical protein